VPDNKLLKVLIKRHYRKATFTVGKGKGEEQIRAYLQNYKENGLVVGGAHQRSELSRWFKTSAPDILMRT
jgi:hypothetical protein